MIPLLVSEIEGGSPERDGGGEGEEEEEGLVWADSSSWDLQLEAWSRRLGLRSQAEPTPTQ